MSALDRRRGPAGRHRGTGLLGPRSDLQNPTQLLLKQARNSLGESMSAPTVYIVDDDASVRKALTRLLQLTGFHVEAFPDARSFLNVERRGRRECLILDVRMPEISGLELRNILLTNGQSIPTIFVTAFPGREMECLALEEDVVEVLPKPFDDRQLLRAIRHALASR